MKFRDLRPILHANSGLHVWLCFSLCIGYVLVRSIDVSCYDDSLFFKRVALNFLEYGAFSWNPGEEPAQGLTSQSQTLVATIVAGFTTEYWIVAMRWLAFIWISGTCALLLRPLPRSAVGGQLLVACTCLSPLVLATLTSGMETALALAVLALAIQRDASHSRWAVPLTIAVYLTRPDAAIIATVVTLGRRYPHRRPLLTYAGGLGLAMIILLVALRGYYGTALPLSFHMKSLALGAYGPHALKLGHESKILHLSTFLFIAAPLVWISLRGRQSRTTETMVLLSSAAIFVSYHLLSTLEIMGMRARFYLPALVPLVLAAASSWPEFRHRRSRSVDLTFLSLWGALGIFAYREGIIGHGSMGYAFERIAWSEYAIFAVVIVFVFLGPLESKIQLKWTGLAALVLTVLYAYPPRISVVHNDRAFLHKQAREVTVFRGIFDVKACLPLTGSTVRTIYHSEMGVTGLVLPKARAIDLVGILSPSTHLSGRPFNEYCQADRPAAIFLPHRNYRELNAEIKASDCLGNYVRVVDHSSSPLFIRKDLAPAFLGCARRVWRWQTQGTRARLEDQR